MASAVQNYRVLSPSDLPTDSAHERFRFDVLQGLSAKPKRLPSAYFYDDDGSGLFSSICELETYYPTKCETEILEAHADEIIDLAHHAHTPKLQVVDLGAGDGRKTKILLRASLRAGVQTRFVPVDISRAAVHDLTEAVSRSDMNELAVEGAVTNYTDGLRWLSERDDVPALVLFLGSNIGNFNGDEARIFLRRMWSALRDGDLVLLGFDRKKDLGLLHAAYDDPQGVTAQFNLNLLTRLNRELGADFDVDRFQHYATYHAVDGAMHSYLLSERRCTVNIAELGRSFDFEPWEPIHTEYSYKYLESDIVALAGDTGFEEIASFDDSRTWFTDRLWRVRKS